MTTAETQVLSSHTVEEIDDWLSRYPADQRQSAVLGALRAAQHQNNGFLTTELMDAVADYIGMPKIAVYEVASFYSMFELKPVARHNVAICTNISCMRTTLAIDDDVLAAVKERARREGKTAGEVLSDLARRQLTQTPQQAGRTRNGLPVLPSRGTPVTNELIDRLRAQEGL